ncbi:MULTISPECIES: outer membrane beta-barrel protein [unclassified Spirosoma]|uniref:outer membrane beta-barrel protein n=1 Tax=unclassified Spirosoma TaxID=2621999 RepID=UPI0009680927|nr:MULTISPECIES: outer membrane beta-barrel protein [unclassified Spirosoma]MBN8822073.1 hypothetical protein [Spirosoma sp.]OJW80476.1 MAG: hypothetical protein BGO59_33895 [Spirosoma sp. 48-14]
MSDEQFDKRLKKRLEAYRPSPTSQGWERIRGRLPVPWFGHWFSQYGGWTFGAFAMLGLIGVLYLWYDQKQELTQLHEQINTFAKQTAQIQSSNHRAMSVRRDTVYVVKRIIEQYDTSSKANRLLADANDLTWPNTHRQETPVSVLASRLRMRSRAASKLAELSRRSTSESQLLAANRSNVSKPKRPIADLSERASGSQHTSVLTNEAIKEPNVPSVSVEVDSVTSRSSRSDSVSTQLQKPAQDMPAVKLPSTSVASTRSVKPAFSLAALRPRLGLTAAVTSGPAWGIGPSVEFFLNRSLSVSTGLQISRYGAERSDHDDDYNRQTGQDFVEKYKAYLPGQYDRIEDIAIQTTALQVPVMLKYYLPLRSQWSLFFLSGTLLNLSAYEAVHFESSFQGAEHHTAFEARDPSGVFQNFVLGAGLQYHYKRFVGQVSPVWQYNFRKSSYTQSQQVVGVNLSLMMDLTK